MNFWSGATRSLPSGEHSLSAGRSVPVSFQFAWFAGANLRTLARVPSEVSFYNALGATVLLLGCVSGYTACLAVAYALLKEVGDVWWIGVGWTVLLVLGIERLILQMPVGSDGKVPPVAVIWRGLLSFVLAVVLSVPLVLRINEGEINKQLSSEEQAAISRADDKIAASFNPKIEKLRDEREGIRRRIASLQRKAAEYRGLSSDAAATGCGADCHRYGRRAHSFSEKVRAVGKRNREHRLGKIQDRLDRLRSQRHAAEVHSEGAIRHSGGLLARINALSALTGRSAAMAAQVLFLHCLFLFLDMTPVVFKWLRIRAGSAYEKQLALETRGDVLAIRADQATIEIAEHRIDEQKRADIEVDRVRINLAADRRVAEAGMEAADSGGAGYPDPVAARSLRSFVEDMQTHDTQPVEVPAALARSGLIGAALIGALTILATLWTTFTGHAVSGMWLIVIAFVAVAALAAYTHGFRRAPAWALRAIFATFLAGLLFPLLIIGINL
jgi:hypothetical protein